VKGATTQVDSRKIVVVLLAAILCLGAALRLYHLSTVPTELIADELDIYNSVASIVTTGHDVDGSLIQEFLGGHGEFLQAGVLVSQD